MKQSIAKSHLLVKHQSSCKNGSSRRLKMLILMRLIRLFQLIWDLLGYLTTRHRIKSNKWHRNRQWKAFSLSFTVPMYLYLIWTFHKLCVCVCEWGPVWRGGDEAYARYWLQFPIFNVSLLSCTHRLGTANDFHQTALILVEYSGLCRGGRAPKAIVVRKQIKFICFILATGNGPQRPITHWPKWSNQKKL